MTQTPTIAPFSVKRAKEPFPANAKLQTTDAWKTLVLRTLERNNARNVMPRNLTELATEVAATKSALSKLLSAPRIGAARRAQSSSKFVGPICRALNITYPLYDATKPPSNDETKPDPSADPQPVKDALDEAVAWIKQEDRERAAAILRAAFGHVRKQSSDH